MRFHLIDAFRGVAALMVVLFHAYEGGHIPLMLETLPEPLVYLLFKMGGAGVGIFFVLSGFVIAHSLRTDWVTPSYFGKFALKRSIRLDPPYWASIALFVGLAFVSATIKREPMAWPSLETILAHLLYAQVMLDIPSINDVYWTLCLEFQFYLVFCLLTAALQRLRAMHVGAEAAAIAAIWCFSLCWPLGILQTTPIPGLFMPLWYAFLLGAFAYWSWQRRVPAPVFYAYAAIILIDAVLTRNAFTIACCVTALIIHEAGRLNQMAMLNHAPMQVLGKVSYSLYLTHGPITGASFFLCYKVLGNSLTSQYIAFVVTVAGCIAFAYAFWWALERTSVGWSKRIDLKAGQASAQACAKAAHQSV